MQLGTDFEASVGTFQTVLGFNGDRQLVPRVIFDSSDVSLDASVKQKLKRARQNKYGHCEPVAYFNSLSGLRLRPRTEEVLVLNDAGKDRLRALLRVSAAGVHASDSL